MLLWYFLQAILIGITVGAVVGPISLLFIRKTLEDGIKSAIAIGLGVALADGVFGVIAAFGISTISYLFHSYSDIIQFIGGAFLLYISYNDIKSKTLKEAVMQAGDYYKLSIKVFFLTLANPVTIASFVGIFASIGGTNLNILESLFIAFGCTIGSMIWWIVLGSILLKTKHKISSDMLNRIRVISSIIIGLFGMTAILHSIL